MRIKAVIPKAKRATTVAACQRMTSVAPAMSSVIEKLGLLSNIENVDQTSS